MLKQIKSRSVKAEVIILGSPLSVGIYTTWLMTHLPTDLESGRQGSRVWLPRYVEPIVEYLATTTVESGLHLVELNPGCSTITSVVVDSRQEQGLTTDMTSLAVNNIMLCI